MERIKLYSDMDGVLADFDRQFERASGYTPDNFVAKERKVALRGGASDDEAYHAAREAFWAVVSRVPNFWLGIPPMPELETYWNGVAKLSPTVLTAVPSGQEGARAEAEKRQWIARTLGAHVPVIVVRLNEKDHNISVKDRYAEGPHCVLIDDNHNYVRTWRAAGGNAVQFRNARQALRDLGRIAPWIGSGYSEGERLAAALAAAATSA